MNTTSFSICEKYYPNQSCTYSAISKGREVSVEQKRKEGKKVEQEY